MFIRKLKSKAVPFYSEKQLAKAASEKNKDKTIPFHEVINDPERGSYASYIIHLMDKHGLTAIGKGDVKDKIKKEKLGNLTIRKLTSPEGDPVYIAMKYGKKNGQAVEEGGNGKFKLGQNIVTGEMIGVKIFPSGKEDAVEKETQVLKSLIPFKDKQLYLIGSGQFDGKTFLAMPLAKGITIEKALEIRNGEENKLNILRDPLEIAELCHSITQNLITLHQEAGYIHNDLKPGNVMIELGLDGKIKRDENNRIQSMLIDVGSAATSGTQVLHAETTPLYLCPERIAYMSEIITPDAVESFPLLCALCVMPVLPSKDDIENNLRDLFEKAPMGYIRCTEDDTLYFINTDKKVQQIDLSTELLDEFDALVKVNKEEMSVQQLLPNQTVLKLEGLFNIRFPRDANWHLKADLYKHNDAEYFNEMLSPYFKRHTAEVIKHQKYACDEYSDGYAVSLLLGEICEMAELIATTDKFPDINDRSRYKNIERDRILHVTESDSNVGNVPNEFKDMVRPILLAATARYPDRKAIDQASIEIKGIKARILQDKQPSSLDIAAIEKLSSIVTSAEPRLSLQELDRAFERLIIQLQHNKQKENIVRKSTNNRKKKSRSRHEKNDNFSSAPAGLRKVLKSEISPIPVANSDPVLYGVNEAGEEKLAISASSGGTMTKKSANKANKRVSTNDKPILTTKAIHRQFTHHKTRHATRELLPSSTVVTKPSGKSTIHVSREAHAVKVIKREENEKLKKQPTFGKFGTFSYVDKAEEKEVANKASPPSPRNH